MHKRDRWIFPIELHDDNNKFVVVRGGAAQTFTISPGIYYAYMGSVPGFPSLLARIGSAINSLWGVTAILSGAVPLDSHAFEGGGLKFVFSEPLAFATTDPAFSDVLRRVLGLGLDDTSASVTYFSPYTTFGSWLEPCAGVSRKSANHTKTQFRGAGISSRTHLNQRWGAHKWRRFNYKVIPAGLVEHGGEQDADYQAVARLAVGDANNLWVDVWEHGLSTGAPVLVMHDTDGIAVNTGAWESVIASGDYMDDFSQTINERAELARVYDIDLIVQSLGGTYASF